MELVDTLVLGTSAKAWGFESLIGHQSFKECMNPSLSRTLEVDIEKCVELIGDRNLMVVIATARARELQQSARHRGDQVYRSATVDALLDIQNGVIGIDYLNKMEL